ncbi:MAG: hypothetical protein ABWK53_04480 [Anaerolineales bacterium]
MFVLDSSSQITGKLPIRIGKTILSLAILTLLLIVGCQPNIPLVDEEEIETPIATPATIQEARQVLEAYYTALTNRDYTTAAALFTTKVGINRSELLQIWEDNDNQGWRLTGYEITDQQQYDETRIVFRVRLTQQGGEPSQFDTINVLHLEEGNWFVGDATLNKIAVQGRPHSRNEVTVVVGVFFRYVEGYALWINIRNDSPNAVIWGTEGEICGRLFFAAYTVQSSCSSPRQILPGEETNVSLIFFDDVLSRPVDDLPANLEVSMFLWDTNSDGIPDSDAQAWSYAIEMEYDNP